MAKGVFLHRPDSIYDDVPEERYQFPAQYHRRASEFVGDWIVYYEPVKSRNPGYFAIAKVAEISRDPTAPEMFRAQIEPSSYMQFVDRVPFQDFDGLVERGLLNDFGKISGRAQAAVRPISVADFDRILSRGIPDEDVALPRSSDQDVSLNVLREERTDFILEVDRARELRLTSRLVRDRVFRSLIVDAYDRRCAVTGLKLVNGGGRAEVEAAHIMPVASGGPDKITNGIALSGTVHWMFDRGLIALADNFDVLISRQVNDAEGVKSLINPSGRALVPRDPALQPHPKYLAWHREHCFKA
ncbi:MAG: HNH endonuclease [Sphingomonadales bacterium]|nr:HNH endonuclease [Sphingomonadales bacterium]